jgi:radical SAM superfamily enzyme with C-terminal helix-hairpin-helix motif
MLGVRRTDTPTALRKQGQVAAIVDCYTVEPSGLGVPPYLSTYARCAFAALKRAFPVADVRYLTIDDVRWCVNGGRPFTEPPLSDQLTYSATVNRSEALQILADAALVVVIAGDAVPSVHLQGRTRHHLRRPAAGDHCRRRGTSAPSRPSRREQR